MKLNIQRWFTIDSNGNEYIYLYYYPTYREMAFMNEVTQWPCKIGRTDQHPVTRVYQQLNSLAYLLSTFSFKNFINSSYESKAYDFGSLIISLNEISLIFELIFSAACFPNTNASSNELLASLLLPWTPVQLTSPTA